MKITIPTTATKLVDILSSSQLEELQSVRDDNPTLRLEPYGGTVYWSMVGDAVVNECASINDGDIEYIDLDLWSRINNISMIANSSGVYLNIEVE